MRYFFFFLVIGALYGCELPPQIEVYNYAFEMKEYEEFPLGWTYERGLPSSIKKTFDSTNNIYKPILTAENENPVILSQKVILKDSGTYFIFGKFGASIEEGAFFVSAEGESFHKKVIFKNNIRTCNRAFFSVHVTDPEVLTLRIGFEEQSSGTAYPDTLFFLKEKYFDPLSIDAREMRRKTERLAGIENVDETELDENIDRLSNLVTSMFVPGNDSEQIFEWFQSSDFNVDQTSYLYSYAMEGPPDSYRAFNLKTSVALDEIIKLYRIPVRQIYLQKECETLHHFIEYWNAQDEKWKIIDPAFGIRYQKDDQFLGFEEVQELALNEELDSTNIRRIYEGGRAFSYSELMDYWNYSATMRTIKK